MAGEPWAPSLGDVARLIPTRTMSTDPLSDRQLVTFTPDTTPTDGQAQDTIDSNVDMITGLVGTLPQPGAADQAVVELCQTTASAAAAWQTAADIELAYPQRDGDIQLWQQLTARAAAALAALRAALAQTGSGTVEAFPIGNFPRPGDLRAEILRRPGGSVFIEQETT